MLPRKFSSFITSRWVKPWQRNFPHIKIPEILRNTLQGIGRNNLNLFHTRIRDLTCAFSVRAACKSPKFDCVCGSISLDSLATSRFAAGHRSDIKHVDPNRFVFRMVGQTGSSICRNPICADGGTFDLVALNIQLRLQQYQTCNLGSYPRAPPPRTCQTGCLGRALHVSPEEARILQNGGKRCRMFDREA